MNKLIRWLGFRYETRHIGMNSEAWKKGLYYLRTGWWWLGIPIGHKREGMEKILCEHCPATSPSACFGCELKDVIKGW